MSPEVTALAEAFALAIHEAVRLELLEEMRAFAEARQKREPRRAPARRKKRRAKRSGGEAQLPRKKVAGRGGRAARDTSTGEVNPAVPGESPGPSSFKMEDLDPSELLATVRTVKLPKLWPVPPPRLSKDGHTRGCRRGSTGKCSPNCAPSIEGAKPEQDVGDDEGRGQAEHPAASAPGESFTTQDIRAAVEVARANDATVHGPDCGRPDSECSPGCFVPVPIDPGSPLAIAAEQPAKPDYVTRPVIVRVDGSKLSRVALMVGEPKDGFYDVRLAMGRNRRYNPRVRRICAGELVRDATDREAVLGHVP